MKGWSGVEQSLGESVAEEMAEKGSGKARVVQGSV